MRQCVPWNSGGGEIGGIMSSSSSSSSRHSAGGQMTKISSVSSASKKDARSHVGQICGAHLSLIVSELVRQLLNYCRVLSL